MNKETTNLLAEYKKEYLRVNNREPLIYWNGRAWIKIDRNFYRKSEVKQMLAILKTRANFS